MPLEIEIKYLDVDLDALRERLAAAGAHRHDRRFEENMVLDDNARSLRGRDVLLRLRRDGDSLVTLKTPAPGEDGLKVRHEHETTVGDVDTALTVFQALGYDVAFRYEKLRETWDCEGCHVCLDLLPFGSFVELEGDPDAIRRAEAALGLDAYTSSDENYHQLNMRYRAAAGLPQSDGFVFSAQERARLRQMADA